MGCFDKAKELFKDLNDSELNQLIKDLKAQKKRLNAESTLDNLDNKMADFENKLGAEIEHAALEAKRHEMLRIVSEKRLKTFHEGFKKKKDGLEAKTVGHPKNMVNGQASTYRLQKAMKAKVFEDLYKDIVKDHPGITKLLHNKKFNSDLADELWAIDLDKQPTEWKSITGNEDAFHVAKQYSKYYELTRIKANEAGATINRRNGYVPQILDTELIFKYGKETFINDMMMWIDADKTFGGDKQGIATDILGDIYHDYISGVHGSIIPRYEKSGIKSPYSLAKSMSKSREIHYKDSHSFKQAMQKYGSSKLTLDGLNRGLERRISDIALLQDWGPNPKKMFEYLLDTYKASESRSEKNMITPYQEARLRNYFRTIAGEVDVPVWPKLARITTTIRNTFMMTYLGKAMISSFNDVTTAAANANYNGIGLLSAYGQIFNRIAQGRAKGEVKDISLKLLDEGFEHIRGSVLDRFSAVDSMPGAMTNMANYFSRLSRLDWWTKLGKETHALMLSSYMANESKVSFNAVHPRFRNTLLRHGITERDWTIIQKARQEVAKGRSYVTPDSILDVADEAFAGLKGKELVKHKEDLMNKLRGLFIEESDVAVITPGAREKALILGGFGITPAQKGTPLTEAIGLMTQFKIFPITMATKVWPRLMEQGVPESIHFIVMLALFGYASNSVKALLELKTPPDPRKPQTMIDAFASGGSLSLLGDLVLKDANRYGGGLLTYLGGPTASTANDLYSVFALAKSGEVDDAGAKITKILSRQVPFVNLFYTSAVYKYLIQYHIMEALNPGSVRKSVRDMEEEYGQKPLVRGLLP